jgi:hypothetical protein
MAVTRLEVTAREPYWGGHPFGDTGAYEKVSGRLHFAVDPAHPANAPVADLSLAPLNADGMVSFSAGFRLLQPVDPARGNRNLLSYVVNRGRQVIPFNRPTPEVDPSETLDPGDGFLMRRGWTVAWCGWQWDVIDDPVLVGLDAPVAINPDGTPASTEIVVQFQPSEIHADQELSHWPQHPAPGRSRFYRHRPYPTADLHDQSATMTVRDWPGGPRTVVPRGSWAFARDIDGHAVADAMFVRLDGGFLPGRIYEVRYRTDRCPVAGTGFVAIRDVATFLRLGGEEDGNPAAGRLDHAFAYGISQCGRFLRDYLHAGMNIDELGNRAYDGILPHVAGARRGEFNHRGAQPSVQHVFGAGHLPPFATDPVPDLAFGLLDNQRRRGGVPKVVSTNSSSEYWRSEATLTHTDLAGLRDVPVAPEERVYLFAGTQHGPGAVPLMTETPYGAAGTHAFNVVDYSPLMRSALVHLERWVCEGVEPPASAVPRLGNGTAVPRATVLATLACLPGMSPADAAHLPSLPRFDPGPVSADGVVRIPGDGESWGAYPSYVSAVDADGNEVAGWRLPDLSVPLGTHTGWNPRAPHTGAPDQLLDMIGSTIPFAVDEASRIASGDPRPSILARYPDRASYLERVAAAADRAIANGHVLAEDRDLLVRLASDRWDALVGHA